jgi:methionyl-tRNA synthetase
MKKFYITTPIYYPNSEPHIGTAYTTIVCDVLARWNKLLGNEVFFLTGTDEHGKKIENVAKENNQNPKEFVDSMLIKFKEAWTQLNINYDRFIRTTDKDHEEVVQNILQKIYDNKDIYLGEYEGYYCTSCEAYYVENDLKDLKCPIHNIKIEKLKEKSYFFKLSKYQKKLLDFFEKNPKFIEPEFRKKEIIKRVKEGLHDLSISRTSFKWGVELPFDKKHIAYVWGDALLNYISGVGYIKDKKLFNKFWPADLHLVAKDIQWFHCVIWPALLLSAKVKLPKKVFSHGFLTIKKEKVSKSGKMITVKELEKYPSDSIRYYLIREVPFGQDGDFSEDSLKNRLNNELANELGNLLSRVLTLTDKNFNGKIKSYTLEKELTTKLNLKKIQDYIESYELHNALSEIFRFISECNKFINKEKLWEQKDKKLEKNLYSLLESLRIISILISPFTPNTSEKINKQLNIKQGLLKDCKFNLVKSYSTKKGEILFKKIK